MKLSKKSVFGENFENESFYLGKDSFTDLSINPTIIDKFSYFKLTNKSIIKRFVLKETEQVLYVVKITLIQKDGFFSPRFTFQVLNKTDKAVKQYEAALNSKDEKELLNILIKANVSLGDCYEEFVELMKIVFEITSNATINNESYKIVNKKELVISSLDDQEIVINFLNSLTSVSKDIDLKKYTNLFTKVDIVQDMSLLYKRRICFDEYKTSIDTLKDEKKWQEFFEKNVWIFGNTLDYRFYKILQREFSASDTDGSGKGQVNADFLIGDNNFSHFVEIKRPDTSLFKMRSNRSGCWLLSTELQDSISQIIEQRESGNIKINTTSSLYNSDGNLILQKPYNPKAILIIGNLKEELSKCTNDKDREVNLKTFESYRNELKNITIITYDEILSRIESLVDDKK